MNTWLHWRPVFFNNTDHVGYYLPTFAHLRMGDITMKKVLKGEKVTRTTTVDNDVVSTFHVTQHGTIGNVATTWHFNFDGIDRDELLILATRSLLIDARRDFKTLPENVAEQWDGQSFLVSDMLTKTRKTATPTKAAQNAWAKMSPEDREAFLASIEDNS